MVGSLLPVGGWDRTPAARQKLKKKKKRIITSTHIPSDRMKINKVGHRGRDEKCYDPKLVPNNLIKYFWISD
jgi:hypothetical protein